MELQKPKVLIHILAKDKEKILPEWLKQNLDRLEYPRDRVYLYFRTNNNNDNTAKILHEWIEDQKTLRRRDDEDWIHYDWASIEIDDSFDPSS